MSNVKTAAERERERIAAENHAAHARAVVARRAFIESRNVRECRALSRAVCRIAPASVHARNVHAALSRAERAIMEAACFIESSLN